MIKILVGMRRTGKSTLMKLFIEDLVASGTDPSAIYYRKFDEELEEERPDLRGLIDDVRSKISVGRDSFIFLDEMQDIVGWERAVESFYDAGAEVYITGSNANTLSSQLASKLSGRFIEINVYPLTFREFVEFRRARGDKSDKNKLLKRFQQTGSLPAVALMEEGDADLIDMMLTGIFNTVFVKDVVQRNEIRNGVKISNLNRFMMRNIGDRVSIRSAAGYLTSTSSKTNPETVDSYISMLESAMLFYRAKRMDSATKDYLRTSEKFYCTDIGIRNSLVPPHPDDIDGIMENIVFMELKKKYGTVCTYDVDGKEVDFAVWTQNYKAYYQVCSDISSADTLKRELAPLKAITDNYPKFIVCKGNPGFEDVEGIRIIDYDEWVKDPF
ncbi:MAG: ATP-binding protein [Candidatus Methanomethylophilus sp.]|nr:ATP-binding protein [Methanomethylophilus sp.]